MTTDTKDIEVTEVSKTTGEELVRVLKSSIEFCSDSTNEGRKALRIDLGSFTATDMHSLVWGVTDIMQEGLAITPKQAKALLALERVHKSYALEIHRLGSGKMKIEAPDYAYYFANGDCTVKGNHHHIHEGRDKPLVAEIHGKQFAEAIAKAKKQSDKSYTGAKFDFVGGRVWAYGTGQKPEAHKFRCEQTDKRIDEPPVMDFKFLERISKATGKDNLRVRGESSYSTIYFEAMNIKKRLEFCVMPMGRQSWAEAEEDDLRFI